MRAEYLRTNEDTQPRLERLLAAWRLPTLAPTFSQRFRHIVTMDAAYLTEVYQEVLSSHGSVEQYLRRACGVRGATIGQLQGLLE